MPRSILSQPDSEGFSTVSYRHRPRYSKEDRDEQRSNLNLYHHNRSEALHIDPSLEVREQNRITLRGYQRRCLKNPAFAYLEEAHPRYDYMGPHSLQGMPPTVEVGRYGKRIWNPDWETQSLAMMPEPVFMNINPTPCVVNKLNEDGVRVRLPRKPKISRNKIRKIEELADDGEYVLPADHDQIAQDLKAYRQDRRITQRTLANQLNQSLATLRKIEKGTLIPDSRFKKAWDDLMSKEKFITYHEFQQITQEDDVQETASL